MLLEETNRYETTHQKNPNPVRKKTEVTPPPTEPIEMSESQNIPETVIEPNPSVYIEDYVSESE